MITEIFDVSTRVRKKWTYDEEKAHVCLKLGSVAADILRKLNLSKSI